MKVLALIITYVILYVAVLVDLSFFVRGFMEMNRGIKGYKDDSGRGLADLIRSERGLEKAACLHAAKGRYRLAKECFVEAARGYVGNDMSMARRCYGWANVMSLRSRGED